MRGICAIANPRLDLAGELLPSRRRSLSARNGFNKVALRESKKDELLQELLELDKEFEASKISKTAYQEQRGKVKAHLRSLMSEQEASRK